MCSTSSSTSSAGGVAAEERTMDAPERTTILAAMESALEGGPPVAVGTVTDAGAAARL